MSTKLKTIVFVCVGILIFAVSLGASAESRLASGDSAPRLAPVGTAFTYQGYIEDEGSPPNGSYDLQFSLWDAPTGGTQAGGTKTKVGLI